MADKEHLKILRQGVDAWNKWRRENPEVLHPDVSRADRRRANLSGANLHGTDLRGANLGGANLNSSDLRGAFLHGSDLRGAFLRDAHLQCASLIKVDLRGADLTGCLIYGVSAWGLKFSETTTQQNLVISGKNDPEITVDNIEVAQFIYLLLHNEKIREVIDTITSKAALILGRFSEERKVVLEAIREELRKHNYLPILFDFPPSPNQTLLETVKTLASMARFVIADLTDARSVLMELGAVVPAFPSVAVRLMIKKSEHEYGMLDSIRLHRSVVEDTYEYEDTDKVIASIRENIVRPAEAKVDELRRLIRPAAR
jgi:uncharacterized protein YjbI with pentapeptide repeats